MVAFVSTAFTGPLEQALFGLISALVGGTPGQHGTSCGTGSPRADTRGVQRYPALCRAPSQPL